MMVGCGKGSWVPASASFATAIVIRGCRRDFSWTSRVRLRCALDIDEDVDVRATDYRVGIPFTYGIGIHQFKFAPYHMSSHLGDEFVLSPRELPAA